MIGKQIASLEQDLAECESRLANIKQEASSHPSKDVDMTSSAGLDTDVSVFFFFKKNIFWQHWFHEIKAEVEIVSRFGIYTLGGFKRQYSQNANQYVRWSPNPMTSPIGRTASASKKQVQTLPITAESISSYALTNKLWEFASWSSLTFESRLEAVSLKHKDGKVVNACTFVLLINTSPYIMRAFRQLTTFQTVPTPLLPAR